MRNFGRGSEQIYGIHSCIFDRLIAPKYVRRQARGAVGEAFVLADYVGWRNRTDMLA